MNKFSVSFRGTKTGNVTINKSGVARYQSYASARNKGLVCTHTARAGVLGAAVFLSKESAAVSCETDWGFTVSK